MTSSAIQAQVHIYESEYRAIIAATRLFAQEETGGDLYGSFTHGGMPVIWLASGPGPRVRRNRTHFEQDTIFTTAWQRRLKNDFGVQFIGTWHSHHHLGLREPSSGDREAARNYARNHDRQKTLEVIVTYERHDEITLWPYFYPNAQEELWVESAFVLLPSVSPIRQSLRNEEMAFSGGSDWRSVPAASSSREQYTKRDSFNEASSHEGASNEQIAIPLEIQSEVESIGDRILDINQAGSTFVINIQVGKDQALNVYIDLRNLSIMRVDLVDTARGNKHDISRIVREENFPLSLRQTRGVLKRLVREFPRIQHKLELSASSNSLVERRTEAPAMPTHQSDAPKPEPQKDAAESEHTGVAEHNQPATSRDTNGHTDSPAKDVIVLVTTNEQHTYHISATISSETQCIRFLQAFAEVRVYEEHIKRTPKEGTGDLSIQANVVLQEVSDVAIVFKRLLDTFPPATIEFKSDDALYQKLVASTSITQDTEGNIFSKFLKRLSNSLGI